MLEAVERLFSGRLPGMYLVALPELTEKARLGLTGPTRPSFQPGIVESSARGGL